MIYRSSMGGGVQIRTIGFKKMSLRFCGSQSTCVHSVSYGHLVRIRAIGNSVLYGNNQSNKIVTP